MKINNKQKYDTFLIGKFVDLVIIDSKFLKNNSWHTWLNDQKLTNDKNIV